MPGSFRVPQKVPGKAPVQLKCMHQHCLFAHPGFCFAAGLKSTQPHPSEAVIQINYSTQSSSATHSPAGFAGLSVHVSATCPSSAQLGFYYIVRVLCDAGARASPGSWPLAGITVQHITAETNASRSRTAGRLLLRRPPIDSTDGEGKQLDYIIHVSGCYI